MKINKTKRKIGALYLFLLALTLTFCVNALTIDQLLSTYDFQYSTGDIKIDAFDDVMIDTDGNSLNDTLVLMLTFNTTTPGNYTIYADLIGTYDIITNGTEEEMSLGIENINISYSSRLLSQSQYNYSVRVYNVNDSLVYRKDKMLTDTYYNYEAGIEILDIDDKSLGNNSILINATLGITTNQTSNITAYLKYGDYYITSKKQFTLTTGKVNAELEFDNETIKGTHYSGNYTLDYLEIGGRIYDTNYNTSYYDYEDFAKTSYLKAYSSDSVDTDANNLSDYLRFNITVESKAADTYNIEIQLYDMYGEYVANASTTESLATGTEYVTVDIDGKDIYSSRLNGPYSLEYATLTKGSDVVDMVYQPYNTRLYSYSDFERSPLPDLTVSIAVSDDNSSANITVSNIGQAPAFNIMLDVFDDVNLSVTEPISYLNVSDSKVTEVNLSENFTLLIAIVDFDNLVDESDETNNIAIYPPIDFGPAKDLSVESAQEIYSQKTEKLFEFEVLNNRNENVNDIAWTFNPGDGELINSTTSFDLSYSESILIYLEYDYSENGVYNASFKVYSGNISSIQYFTVYVGEAVITELNSLYSASNQELLEFIILNNGNEVLDDISWAVNLGDGNIVSSSETITLNPAESIAVYFEYSYGESGIYEVMINASTSDDYFTDNITLYAGNLYIKSLEEIYSAGHYKLFEGILQNFLDFNLYGINWCFSTNNQSFCSNETFNLTPLEEIFIYFEYEYSDTGNFSVQFNASNEEYANSKGLTTEVKSIEIENLEVLKSDGSERTFWFTIENNLEQQVPNIAWLFQTGEENKTSESNITLDSDEDIFVIIHHDYTTTGEFDIIAEATNSTVDDRNNITINVT